MSVDNKEDNYDSDFTPEVNKGGRPSYEVNDKDEGALTALLSIGFPHRQIALYMNRNIKTLKKHYPELFETLCPMDEKTANVENALYYLAVHKLNVVACLAWLKAHKRDVYGDKEKVHEDDPETIIKHLRSLAKALPE